MVAGLFSDTADVYSRLNHDAGDEQSSDPDLELAEADRALLPSLDAKTGDALAARTGEAPPGSIAYTVDQYLSFEVATCRPNPDSSTLDELVQRAANSRISTGDAQSLVEVLVRNERWSDAELVAGAAVADQPDSADALVIKAWAEFAAYDRTGSTTSLSEAEASISAALKLDGDNFDALSSARGRQLPVATRSSRPQL